MGILYKEVLKKVREEEFDSKSVAEKIASYAKRFDEPYVKDLLEKDRILSQVGSIKEHEKRSSFDGYRVLTKKTNEIVTALKLWNFTKAGMYIYGRPGCGKTEVFHCFKSFLHEKGALKGKTSRTFNAVHMMKDLKDFDAEAFEYGKTVRRHDWYMDICKNVDLLMLDDFGAGRKKPSEFEVEVFYDIIEYRNSRKKPMFMTSNLDIRQVNDSFGARIASRICELMVFVEHDGHDNRIEIQKKNRQRL